MSRDADAPCCKHVLVSGPCSVPAWCGSVMHPLPHTYSERSFLKAVDRFEDMAISAYVSAGGVRFMLLHPPMRSDDGLRNFFGAVHELYLKVVLNPFYEPHSPIASGPFDAKVRALAKKYLGR